MTTAVEKTGSPVNEIAAAKTRVMRAVPYVQKRGEMKFGEKYTYARESDFIAALHPAMCDAGLTVHVHKLELIGQFDAGTTRNGHQQNRVVILGTIRLVHDRSGQFEDVQAFGEGIDTGDKAFNKAMTGAMKYALRQSFMIETGNDPDDTPSSQQAQTATVNVDELIKEMTAAINSATTTPELIAKWKMIYRDKELVNGRFAEVEKFKDAKKAQLAATETTTTTEQK